MISRKIPKGLKVRQIRAGSGAVAQLGQLATIHYDCYLPRGEKCDSSRDKEYPVQLRVGHRHAYPVFAYGVPGMAVGEIREVKVAPNLTYYERKKNPNLPASVALKYEIELVSLSDHRENRVVPNQ